jgi:uncharacterized glyoxalase superfamily protein PhnB
MGITAIDHLYLEVRNLEASLDFWRVLGFTVERSWGEAGHRASMLRSAGAVVVLAEAGPAREPQRPTVHFTVENPEALGDHLAASAGARVVTPLEATHWGTRWIRVEDPEGNLFCPEELKPA